MVFEFHTAAKPLGECQHFFRQAVRRRAASAAPAFAAQMIIGRLSAQLDQYPVWQIRVALRSPNPARTTGVLAVCPVSSVFDGEIRMMPHRCCVLFAESSRRTWFLHSCSSLWHTARPTTMRPAHLVATGSKCARAKSGWFPSFPSTFNPG